MFRLMHDHRASVTVFITLMLIPSLIITGFMVDLARYKGGFQEMQNALQLEGSSVLGKYDGLLHEIYGLFAVTQKEEVLQELEKYLEASFDPTGYGKGISVSGDAGTFNPYGGAEREISWEAQPESSLRNGVVMQNQISDYMKYRAALSLIGSGDIPGALESAEKLKDVQKDSALINAKAKLDKAMGKVGTSCKPFYEKVLALEEYYKGADEKSAFLALRKASDEISGYYQEIEDLMERETEDEKEAESIEDQIDALYDQIEGAAGGAARQQKEDADALKKNYTPYFEYEPLIDPFWGTSDGDIMDLAIEIDKELSKAQDLYNDLKMNALPSASDELKAAMNEELKEYDALLREESFVDLAEDIYTNQERLDKVCKNIEDASYGGTSFSSLASDAEAHSKSSLSGGVISPRTDWKTARESNAELMTVLADWASQATVSKEDEKAVKEQQKERDKALEKMLEEQKSVVPEKGASRIPDEVYAAQASSGSRLDGGKNLDSSGDELTQDVSGNVSGMSAGGYSEYNGIVNAAGAFANDAIDKLLVTEYGVSMFSCAATNKTKKAADKSEDTTLSGIPLDPKVNFLYQSEMEYLFAGNQDAVTNLLATQGSIYGIQFVLNFSATYRDRDLNTAIKAAGKLLGAGYPPTVIAATLILRGAAAAAESANDLYVLTNGGKVPLLKNSLHFSFDSILADTVDGSAGKGTFEVEYEDYMRLLFLIFIDSSTITKRSTDLVELNISNYKSGGGGTIEELFSLEKSFTAIQLKGTIQTNFLFNATPFTGAKDPTGGISHTITLNRGY